MMKWIIPEMTDKFKDILSNLSTEVDQETLMLYLQNKLSAEKKHEIEKKLLESEFTNDAIEGLQEIKNKKQIAYTVDMLNRDLKKKLEKKKKRREKMQLKDQSWIYIVILIFILLIIISYIVIQRFLHQ